jgi:hypothetical protein
MGKQAMAGRVPDVYSFRPMHSGRLDRPHETAAQLRVANLPHPDDKFAWHRSPGIAGLLFGTTPQPVPGIARAVVLAMALPDAEATQPQPPALQRSNG